MSNCPEYKLNPKETRELAFDLTLYGFDIINNFDGIQTHTRALLTLTLIETYIAKKEYIPALVCLNGLLNQRLIIHNPNQKARVLRKTGMLLRRVGRYSESLIPSIKACFVPGSAFGVRLKSLHSLFFSH